MSTQGENVTIWWAVDGSIRIKPVEVVSETEKMLSVRYDWFGKISIQKTLKENSYCKHFKTWDEAHNYLLERCKKSREGAIARLDMETKELEQVLAMTKPEGAA